MITEYLSLSRKIILTLINLTKQILDIQINCFLPTLTFFELAGISCITLSYTSHNFCGKLESN